MHADLANPCHLRDKRPITMVVMFVACLCDAFLRFHLALVTVVCKKVQEQDPYVGYVILCDPPRLSPYHAGIGAYCASRAHTESEVNVIMLISILIL